MKSVTEDSEKNHNSRNIFFKFFDWCKRTILHPTTTSTEITDKNGNQQFASGTFTRADGTTGTFGEFLVKTETSNSIATEWLEETDGIAELPDISGSGNIYSLHQAMLRDESGELVA